VCPDGGAQAPRPRLLIAGLQRKGAAETAIILVDETEYGLEPHRIISLLCSLGAKEKDPPLQVAEAVLVCEGATEVGCG
jgi:hypothetical protein